MISNKRNYSLNAIVFIACCLFSIICGLIYYISLCVKLIIPNTYNITLTAIIIITAFQPITRVIRKYITTNNLITNKTHSVNPLIYWPFIFFGPAIIVFLLTRIIDYPYTRLTQLKTGIINRHGTINYTITSGTKKERISLYAQLSTRMGDYVSYPSNKYRFIIKYISKNGRLDDSLLTKYGETQFISDDMPDYKGKLNVRKLPENKINPRIKGLIEVPEINLIDDEYVLLIGFVDRIEIAYPEYIPKYSYRIISDTSATKETTLLIISKSIMNEDNSFNGLWGGSLFIISFLGCIYCYIILKKPVVTSVNC